MQRLYRRVGNGLPEPIDPGSSLVLGTVAKYFTFFYTAFYRGAASMAWGKTLNSKAEGSQYLGGEGGAWCGCW